ncbi:MAG: prolyl oligopeptidase family serine peptidase [Pseudomonadota bacterium]
MPRLERGRTVRDLGLAHASLPPGAAQWRRLGRPGPALRAVLLLVGVALAGAGVAQSAPTHRDVTYATVGGRALQLDLYLPAVRTSPRPTLIWVHGGGWQSGSRSPPPAFATALVDRGIAVASISYRLTSQAGGFGSEGVTFPAQIHDVRAAIRFLRATAATYALDPARFGAWGSSAGGHLVALAGTSGNDPALEGTIGGNLRHSSRLQAVVDYYGPTDLLNMGLDEAPAPGRPARHDLPTSPESLLVGFSAADEGLGVLRANEANPLAPYPVWRTLAVQANPITWVDAVDPPFFIAHGTADGTVPPRQSERLRDALRAAGASPVHVAIDGAGHGGFPAAVQQQAQDFLVARLTAPVIAIGEPRGLTGAWYDPAQSGQGFEFLWLDGGRFVVTFYGHRDDGGNLFLIGTREGAPAYGEDLRIDLVATRGGRFNGFDAARIRREPWGALALRIDACDRATATLDGADGRQSFALAKLAGGPGPACD